MGVRHVAKTAVNGALRPFGVQVIRGWTTDPGVSSYISARKTISAAKRAGLSIGDYIDQYSAEPGATAATVDTILRLGEFGGHVERVCEIGAGTGRYAERLIAALRPDVYEVYETAQDWLPYLRTFPNLVTHPADGHTLSHTGTASVDLVHANKIFVYVPFVITAGYLMEMARVVRPGGVVAFDVVTEDCLDEATVQTWVEQNSTIYGMTSRTWVVDLLARHDLTLLGNLFVPMSDGRTELLVFRRA